jgi:hypothetical protein
MEVSEHWFGREYENGKDAIREGVAEKNTRLSMR